MADWLIGASNDGYPFLDGVSLDTETYVRTVWFVKPKTDNLWGINSKVNDGYPFILFQFDAPSTLQVGSCILKRWDGSKWVVFPERVWNNTEWVVAKGKIFK